MIDAKAVSALIGGPITAFAYLAKEKEKKEKYEAEGQVDPAVDSVAAGAIVAGFWGFFLMIMLILFLPLVIAIVMAVKCQDKFVNVMLAIIFPLFYIIGRLISPCTK